MAQSETEIANMALIMLGKSPLNSLNDSSQAGTAAKTLYYPARDSLLREMPWNFARKQVALAQLNAVPINLELLPQNHGPGQIVYTNAFALPGDFLRLFRFAPEDTRWRLINVTGMPGLPAGSSQLGILTDAIPPSPPANLFATQPLNADGTDNLPGGAVFIPAPATVGIEYIAKIQQVSLYDSMFVDCLASKLAYEMAFALTGLESMVNLMGQRFKDKLTEAAFVNGAENWPDQIYDNTIVDARYGYTGITIGA